MQMDIIMSMKTYPWWYVDRYKQPAKDYQHVCGLKRYIQSWET